ncbi:MAG: shikimate dehydrogenase [Clostridiales bacterium]|nr:shikimate dehydrogenase [Clostridiales bacterium]
MSGKTRVCGLLANPVEHTLSPILHNTLAEKTGIHLVYVPLKPELENLGAAVEGAYSLNMLGLNVSIPFKQEVMKYLVDIDKSAKDIGAVNTLVRTDSGFKGYNTDISGLKKAFIAEGIKIKDENVIILGAGGAAKAIAYLMALEGASKIYILNRTYDRATIIAKEINECFSKEVVIPMSIKEYKRLPKDSYLGIQTTSVGMYPNVSSAVVEDPEFYKLLHTAYDIIYSPAETKFMKYTKEAGGRSFNGLKMLLYQGVVAYELWNQIQVSDEIVDEVYTYMEQELRK